jgi:hypothetical protein
LSFLGLAQQFILLGCSRQDVQDARTRAAQHIAESAGIQNGVTSTLDSMDHEEPGSREMQTELRF